MIKITEIISVSEDVIVDKEQNTRMMQSPLGNCGFFGIKYFTSLDTLSLLQRIYIGYKHFSRPNCLLNDNANNFKIIYEKELEPFIYWKSEEYINPNSENKCLFVLLDCEKITDYLSDNNVLPNYRILEEENG